MPPNYSSYRKRGLNGQYRFDPDLTMSPQARGRAVRGSLGEKGYVHIVNIRVFSIRQLLKICFFYFLTNLVRKCQFLAKFSEKLNSEKSISH